jgi:hypothetical protein
MGTRLINKQISNANGTNLNALKVNAGSKYNIKFVIGSEIKVFSLNNSWTFNYTTESITWNGGNWLTQGFRLGDTVEMVYYTSGGSGVYPPFSMTISYISESEIQFDSSIPHQLQADEYMMISSSEFNKEFILSYAHILNEVGGNDLSLIDGTRSIYKADVTSLLVNNTINLTQSGYKSGTYDCDSVTCKRIADVGNERRYEFTFNGIIQDGIILQDSFTANDCLKLFVKFDVARNLNDVDYRNILTYDELCDTGWFDEGFNTETPNTSLIQGVNEIFYNAPTQFTLKVAGTTQIRIGGVFTPKDDTLFKQKYQSQSVIGLYCYADAVVGSYSSQQNTLGAGYVLNILSVNIISGVSEISCEIVPNQQMADFFDLDERQDDKNFILFVEAGNTNWIAYNDELQYKIPASQPLVFLNKKTFFDHSQNIIEPIGNGVNIKFHKEDDLAFWGNFLLKKNEIYEKLIVSVRAFNMLSGENFELEKITYTFNSYQINSQGIYLINSELNVNNNLPSNSEKKKSKLYLFPSIDTPTEYGVALYYPFLIKWQNWIEQQNASADFYPNQNQDWINYQSGNWRVQFSIELRQDDLSYVYSQNVQIMDYDSEVLIDTEIKTFRPDGTEVQVIVEGEIMKIQVFHTLTNNKAWKVGDVWGMITVEETETNPRWICSSVLPFDNNQSNPLKPLDGVQMVITYPSQETALMECYFDTTLLNLENGCKFTSKIKGCTTNKTPEVINKITEDGENKITEDNFNKIIE